MSDLAVFDPELVECEVVEFNLDDAMREFRELEEGLQRQTKATRIRQGEILCQIKNSLDHGQFTYWLQTMGWSPRTARHYMSQAREQLGLPASVEEEPVAPIVRMSRVAATKNYLREIMAEANYAKEYVVIPIGKWEQLIELYRLEGSNESK